MTKYLVALFTLVLSTINITLAQKGYNEGSAFVKPIFYLNNMDIKYAPGNPANFNSRATISNSLNARYSRITKDKVILSSGFGLGERHYYLNAAQVEIANARIYYLNWDLNAGYRFSDKENLKQEIRFGNYTNTALGELPLSARLSNARGSLGRNKAGNGTCMIQYLQWNMQIRNRLIVGLQIERKLFDAGQQINYVEYGMNRNGIDIYNSSQTGAALIVGLTF